MSPPNKNSEEFTTVVKHWKMIISQQIYNVIHLTFKLNIESDLTQSMMSKLIYYQLLLPTFINYFINFNMVSSTDNFPIKSSIKTTNSIIKRSLSTRIFVPRNRFERLTHSLEGCCSIIELTVSSNKKCVILYVSELIWLILRYMQN